jgi:hypothetical protein
MLRSDRAHPFLRTRHVLDILQENADRHRAGDSAGRRLLPSTTCDEFMHKCRGAGPSRFAAAAV